MSNARRERSARTLWLLFAGWTAVVGAVILLPDQFVRRLLWHFLVGSDVVRAIFPAPETRGAIAAGLLLNDELIHVLLFFGLAVTAAIPVRALSGPSLALLASGGFALASATELVQDMVSTGRSSEFSDIGFNLLGFFAGLALVVLWRRLRRRRRRR